MKDPKGQLVSSLDRVRAEALAFTEVADHIVNRTAEQWSELYTQAAKAGASLVQWAKIRQDRQESAAKRAMDKIKEEHANARH